MPVRAVDLVWHINRGSSGGRARGACRRDTTTSLARRRRPPRRGGGVQRRSEAAPAWRVRRWLADITSRRRGRRDIHFEHLDIAVGVDARLGVIIGCTCTAATAAAACRGSSSSSGSADRRRIAWGAARRGRQGPHGRRVAHVPAAAAAVGIIARRHRRNHRPRGNPLPLQRRALQLRGRRGQRPACAARARAHGGPEAVGSGPPPDTRDARNAARAADAISPGPPSTGSSVVLRCEVRHAER